MEQSPVYTYPSSCRDCYRCVRVCPVGAIRVSRDVVSVISEECVACGLCVRECPKGLQRVRSDVERAAELLRSTRRVVVSLAPSWVSEFPHATAGSLLKALRALGFRQVSEMALGAGAASLTGGIPAGVPRGRGFHTESLPALHPLDSPRGVAPSTPREAAAEAFWG